MRLLEEMMMFEGFMSFSSILEPVFLIGFIYIIAEMLISAVLYAILVAVKIYILYRIVRFIIRKAIEHRAVKAGIVPSVNK